jgi:hypothetical protein
MRWWWVLALVACSGKAPDVNCRYDCPLEPEETCGDCSERIATCCYLGGESDRAKVAWAMAVCEGDPGCRACCDECAALTCEEIVANGDCPAFLGE